MNRGMRILIWVAALMAVAVVAHLAFFARDAEPTIRFYGLVVDEQGRPVAGARVVAAAYNVKPALVTQELQRVMETEATQTVDTDEHGRFALAFNDRYDLYIQSIKKPGYDWMFDWAWNLRRPGFERKENRFYRYANPYQTTGVYVSDADRPAVFPMYRKGSNMPTTRPSRGGWEALPEGRSVANEPTRMSVPSAGPGAAAPDEVERRLQDLGPDE
jgi:hypothetical protein